ncbi:MAG: alpha/beta fold hydrolase [Candidatus Nanopelagicales bacterium]
MSMIDQHNVRVQGSGERTYVLSCGIGGTQSQWDPVVADLSDDARLVTFDLAGFGDYNRASFNMDAHASVWGYADDLARLLSELGLRGAYYVGHSMAGMAGLLAAAADPSLFRSVVTIGASARYIDDPATEYVGGFSREAVDAMLEAIAVEYDLWVAGFAPYVMKNEDRPLFAREFERSLAACPPDVALTAFRAAFTSDFRAVMPRVAVPTLVLNTADDPAVPAAAACWLAEAIPRSSLSTLSCAGHFPHVVDAQSVIAAIRGFAGERP